jgi:hypothetical protein
MKALILIYCRNINFFEELHYKKDKPHENIRVEGSVCNVLQETEMNTFNDTILAIHWSKCAYDLASTAVNITVYE